MKLTKHLLINKYRFHFRTRDIRLKKEDNSSNASSQLNIQAKIGIPGINGVEQCIIRDQQAC
jgi:hypothetical protein